MKLIIFTIWDLKFERCGHNARFLLGLIEWRGRIVDGSAGEGGRIFLFIWRSEVRIFSFFFLFCVHEAKRIIFFNFFLYVEIKWWFFRLFFPFFFSLCMEKPSGLCRSNLGFFCYSLSKSQAGIFSLSFSCMQKPSNIFSSFFKFYSLCRFFLIEAEQDFSFSSSFSVFFFLYVKAKQVTCGRILYVSYMYRVG